MTHRVEVDDPLRGLWIRAELERVRGEGQIMARAARGLGERLDRAAMRDEDVIEPFEDLQKAAQRRHVRGVEFLDEAHRDAGRRAPHRAGPRLYRSPAGSMLTNSIS